MFSIRFASIALTMSTVLFCESPLWAADCNGNGTDDTADIATGASQDCNGNGVPDECDLTFTLGFADAISLPVSGVGPLSLLAEDLDNDGDLDLAGAAGNNVPTLLNNGDATFKSGQYASVRPNANSIVAADFDLDGDLDFATSSYDPPAVSVLLNNGETTFTESLILPVGRNPWSITSGDFDGNSDIDLAVADRLDGVWILRNSRDGVFAVSDNLLVGDIPESVIAADLDRDGDLDLATANVASGSVSILLNNVNGTFEVATNYNTGGSAGSLTVADLDNDGDSDLAVTNLQGNVAVLLNDGDTTFQLAENFATGFYPHSITATDLDGDRDLDLAMVNVGTVANPGGTISILVNSGGARFTTLQTMAVNGRPVALGAADLDRDDDADLAVAICGTANCGANNYIAVLLNQGQTIPRFSQDINHNGIPDECEVLPPQPCTPDAEVYDEMQTELAHNIEVFGLGRVCTADLTGTIGVKRYLPYIDPATGLRTIATKITKLELTGTDPSCGEVKISLNPSLASGGKVVEQKTGTCFPADSYFDVYIQVQVPGQKLLANCQPATMRCTVSALPPIGCVYQLGTGFDIPLYDAASLNCETPGNPLANIVAADHKPTQGQGTVVIPPPERVQLNFYDPTTNQWLPLPDQVRKDYFQPTLPVVIIVHGWNSDFLDHLAPWSNEVASAIAARLPDPSNPIQTKVNILAWDWMEEARGGTRETSISQQVQNSAQQTPDQARKLARELQRLFQANPTTRFEKPIHLMGHSHGSILSVLCALQLQNPAFGGGTYPVANVTLWDPVDQFELFGTVFTFGNSLPVNVPLLRERGTVVDCFTGTFNVLTYFANVWYVVPGSLLDPGRGHDTYRWYQTHLLEAVEPTLHRRFNCDDTALPSTVGFGASATHAPAVRQLRLDVCQPAERDVSLVAHSADGGCRARDEFVYAQYCIANVATTDPIIAVRLDTGIANGNCECTLPPDLDPENVPRRVRMQLRRGGAGGGGQEKNLTATYTLPLTVAPAFDYVSFTYRIEAAPAPATMTLSIQDGESVVPLWLATSDSDLGELADSTLLNITPYHGKEVSLIFSLTADQPDAIVEVSNLTLWQGPFHDNVAPAVHAGVDQAVAVTDPLATAVTLDGSGSTDANGDPLVYAWTATQDPAVAELEGIIAVGVQPTVELPLGGYQFTLHARDPFDGFSSDSVIVEVEYPFIRGDSNANGQVNIADAIATLNWLFNDTGKPLCKDAADTNDLEGVNLTDPIALLGFLFLGTEAPQPPFPGVGLDPTPDTLGCDLKQH